MFRKKRIKPWFLRTIVNLFALSLIYRLARKFLSLAEKQNVSKKKIQKDSAQS